MQHFTQSVPEKGENNISQIHIFPEYIQKELIEKGIYFYDTLQSALNTLSLDTGTLGEVFDRHVRERRISF